MILANTLQRSGDSIEEAQKSQAAGGNPGHAGYWRDSADARASSGRALMSSPTPG